MKKPRSTNDKTLEEQATLLCELIKEVEREVIFYGGDAQRLSELEQMIEPQIALVIRMINEYEEEFLPPQPKKPHLRIVK
jgi:hypothetical protein